MFVSNVVFDFCVSLSLKTKVSSSQSTFLHEASNACLSQVERGLASKCQFRRLLLTIASQAIAISNAYHPHHHHIIIISSSSSYYMNIYIRIVSQTIAISTAYHHHPHLHPHSHRHKNDHLVEGRR